MDSDVHVSLTGYHLQDTGLPDTAGSAPKVIDLLQVKTLELTKPQWYDTPLRSPVAEIPPSTRFHAHQLYPLVPTESPSMMASAATLEAGIDPPEDEE